MKFAVATLISLFVILTLFALYQYKAKNRQWGMAMMGWLALLAMLIGVKIRFNSFMLPVCLAGGFGLAYFVGWRLIGNQLAGWKQHIARGMAFAVCLGPIAAVRFRDLQPWFQTHHFSGPATTPIAGSDIAHFLLFGIPGFALVGIAAILLSIAIPALKGEQRQALAYRRVAVPALVLLQICCINWYAAGAIDVFGAIVSGHHWRAKYAIVSRPGIGNAVERHRSFLYFTVEREEIELVSQMLAMGVRMDSNGRGYEPALHLCAAVDNKEIAELLIAYGAPINGRDRFGRTPLDLTMAERPGRTVNRTLVDWLRTKGAKTGYELDYPLHGATAAGDAAAINAFLAGGAEPNARDHLGRCPTHIAAATGSTDVLLQLVRAGSDAKARDKRLQTPLMVATINGHTQCIELLLGKDASVSDQDARGWTALHHAARIGNPKAVKLLLEAGADPKAEGMKGATPLKLALLKEQLSLVDPEATEEHTANAFRCAELLIEDSCINKKHNGRTLLDQAILMRWHKEILDFLRRHSAKTAAELEAKTDLPSFLP